MKNVPNLLLNGKIYKGKCSMILFLSKKKSTYSEQKKDKKEIHRHGVFMSDSGM